MQSVSLSNSRTCHPLKRSLVPVNQEPFSSLRQPLKGHIPLSVRSFLLCTFCISGITSVSDCLHLECLQSSSVLEHISVHLFPCLNKIPLSVFTTVCLSIYQLMDNWAVPTVLAIGLCWWGRLCMRFCMNPFSFLLGKYPGVELVVTFLGKCQASSAVAAPLYIHMSSVFYLHVLANRCHLWVFGCSHPSECEGICHCAFNFLLTKDIEHLFTCFLHIL